MSLRSAPAGVWRYAKCIFHDVVPTSSQEQELSSLARDAAGARKEEGMSDDVHIAQSSEKTSMMVFGTCSEERDIPTSSMSLDHQRSVFHANLKPPREPTVEEVFRSPSTWFTDDAMNLGIGCLWAGLLPAMSFRSTQKSTSPPQQQGTCLFLSTMCWCAAANLRDTYSKSSAAAITLSGVQSEKNDSAPQSRSKRRRGSSSRSGQRAEAPRSLSSGTGSGPDAALEEDEDCVVVPMGEGDEGASAGLHGHIKALRSLIRKAVSNTFRSTASGATNSNLLHAARCHDIDILIVPAFVGKNHWVTVALVGLRSLAEMLIQSNSQQVDGVEKQPTTHTRIVILDSLAGGARREGKAMARQDRKAERRGKSARRLADAVFLLLANESLHLSGDIEESTPDERLAEALREKVTFVSKRVQVSMPPVPRQNDFNQCGPMALLAMEALCHDPSFRQFCFEFEEDTENAGSSQRPSEPYVFEDSFELRCRLLRIFEEGRAVAKANVMACKVHT